MPSKEVKRAKIIALPVEQGPNCECHDLHLITAALGRVVKRDIKSGKLVVLKLKTLKRGQMKPLDLL